MIISKLAKVLSDKPLYKEKKKTDKGFVWVYDSEHVKKRWKEKKDKIKKLQKSLDKLRKKYEKDLSSDDLRTKALAAIVGVMDETAMRIGNEESARDAGTYGASTLKVKHVSFTGSKAKFKFTGKGGVKQETEISNKKVISAIKQLIKGKNKYDFIFEVDGTKIWDRAVNRYLGPFNISAKDLRGFHSNRLMKEKLKKKDWKEALEEVADIVGHKPSTLKNQYLDPELVEKYENKKKAIISIRHKVAQEIATPEFATMPIEVEELGKPISIYRNRANIKPGAELTPTIVSAWNIIAPFLPEGSILTSGLRGPFDQARIILEYWLSVRWDDPKGYRRNEGFFHKNFSNKMGISTGLLRRLHQKAVAKAPFTKRELAILESLRKVMANYKNNIPGGPTAALDIAPIEESTHQYGTTFDISGTNLKEIRQNVEYVASVFPESIQLANLIYEPGNRAIHVELARSVMEPNKMKYIAVLQQHQSGGKPVKASISKHAQEDINISLTDKEQQIFDILLDAIKHFNLGSTIRVAGGWVRDKVMGKQSKDIDIAVDNMSGKEFAENVVRYAQMRGLPVKSVGVIEARPEQSKHLETAVVNLLGESIDFVNLRAEKYDPATRIPQVVPGTAIEDAFRRDFTINALFYNINGRKVEDFTGTGVEDIRNGIIRTPIPPKEIWPQVGITDESQIINPKKTFMDDPLRILRAIRFASRYGFQLAPELIEAAKDEEVQESFKNKISRERIEAELRKMLGGANPVQALRWVKELGLRSEVLKLPEGMSEWEMDQKNPHHQLNIWDHLLETLTNLQQIIKDRNLSEADKFAINLAAFLHDVGKLDPKVHGTKEIENKIVSTYHGHEESSIAIAEYMLRNLPGVRVEEIERIKKLIDAARRVNPQRQESSEVANMSRKALGKFVRLIGEDWESAIDIAMADASAHKKDWLKQFDPTYYRTLKQQVGEMGLEKAHQMKPILDGREIMQLVGRKKGGPWLGQTINELIDWQLENPQATKEDAKEYLKKMYVERGFDKMAILSKRAKLRPEDAKIIDNMKARQQPVLSTRERGQSYESLGILSGVKPTPVILNAWRTLLPFLRSHENTQNAVMTSGFRTKEDQIRIIDNFWDRAGGPSDYPQVIDPTERAKILTRYYGYIVGPPETEREYAHLKGTSFDISGGDLDTIADIVRFVSYRLPAELTATVEPKNNAVHVNVKEVSYDPQAVSSVLSEFKAKFANTTLWPISKLAKKEDYSFESVYEDLMASNPPEEVLEAFMATEQRADDEPNKYEREKADPKWKKPLLKDWTREEIRNHYAKNADKILKEIKGKPVMLYIGTEKDKNILKRKHNDKPIVINNKEDLIYWADRRLLSLHRVFGPKTKLGFVDLDVHGDFSDAAVKKYAREVASKIRSKYGTSPTIFDSGGSGYHIEFTLKQEKDTDTLRNELRELCEELNEKYDGFTTGIVKGSGVRTDTTTLKNNGNIRVPYALHESKGGIKKPLGADKKAFISKRANELLLVDNQNKPEVNIPQEQRLNQDSGFGKDDEMGDWFEKSPQFVERENVPDYDIHDIGESEASQLATNDPEKFFYKGLHKDFPKLEPEALKSMIKENPKFYFVFKYHTREEPEFKVLLQPAAEALSQEDVRAFFYYHLHQNFPELGRGAIVQLIDKNPDSYFDLGLDKEYPDYVESANNARNIKDPNKVELELDQVEMLKND